MKISKSPCKKILYIFLLVSIIVTIFILTPKKVADITVYSNGWGDDYERYTVWENGQVRVMRGIEKNGRVSIFLRTISIHFDATLAHIFQTEKKQFTKEEMQRFLELSVALKNDIGDRREITDGAIVILMLNGKRQYAQDWCQHSKNFEAMLNLIDEDNMLF